MHIALHMIAMPSDRDSTLYKADNKFSKKRIEELIIIFDGKLAITTNVDKDCEITLDYIGKGTILNSHNILSRPYPTATVRCLTHVTYYYLPYEKLHRIAVVYPALMNELIQAQK
jgi:CRP-like cAMP-binding protein